MAPPQKGGGGEHLPQIQFFHLHGNRNIRHVYELPIVIVACLRVLVLYFRLISELLSV